jgi:hypothetical protein
MTRLLSVARSSGAWPLRLIGIGLFALAAVGCAGSLPSDLTGGGGSGGGGGGDAGMGGRPMGCANATSIFTNKTCTTICHSAAGAPAFGGFDMTGAGWPNRLVGGMPPAQTMANMNKCGGMTPPLVYLKPNVQPAQGLFLDKLKPNPSCGVQMPMAMPGLGQADMDCIQNWANNVVAGGNGTQ